MQNSPFERLRASRLMDPVRGTLIWNEARRVRDGARSMGQRVHDATGSAHSTQGIPAAACGPELEHVKGIYRRIIPPVLDREIYRRNFELLTDVLDGAGIEGGWVDSVGPRGRRAIGVGGGDRGSGRCALGGADR